MSEQFVEIDIRELKEYPDNARVGDVNSIYESLLENGQYRPLVVNRKDNVILAGNHTYKAIKRLGWAKALVWYVDVDDQQAKQIVLVDNKLNDDGTYDFAKLEKAIKGLQDVGELIGTGYTAESVAELLETVEVGVPVSSPQSTPKPEPKVTPVLDVVLLLTDKKFDEYKSAINVIADYYKCNPTTAGLKAVELYARKVEANEV